MHTEISLLCASLGFSVISVVKALLKSMNHLSRKPALVIGLPLAAFSLMAVKLDAAPPVRGPATEAAGTSAPSFEVVSIKLCKERMPLAGIHLFNGRFNATSSALGLILWAYGSKNRPLSRSQVTGAEGWAASDLYDVDAKVDDSLVEGGWNNLSFEQKWARVMLMIQTMLADRFELQLRHVTRERPVFELVVAKNGPKFREDDTQLDKDGISGRGAWKFEAASTKISTLASLIAGMPELGGRVVLDKTGLTGHYSFTFQWKPELPANMTAPPADGGPSEPSGPSLFTALQEQLGLKLVPTKAPVDILVIDHIERPTEN